MGGLEPGADVLHALLVEVQHHLSLLSHWPDVSNSGLMSTILLSQDDAVTIRLIMTNKLVQVFR